MSQYPRNYYAAEPRHAGTSQNHHYPHPHTQQRRSGLRPTQTIHTIRYLLTEEWTPKNNPTSTDNTTTNNIKPTDDEAACNRRLLAGTVIALVIGAILLILPLWIMAKLPSENAKLGVITGLVLIYLALCGWIRGCKPEQTLAGAAGYTAVLVVFLGTASVSNVVG